MSLEHSFSTDGEEFSEAIVNFDGENGNQDNDPSVKFPIRQLNTMFDSCAQVDKPEDEQMRVFLRVRPFTGKQTDSTITVESDTSIVTNAPENSKRAQYTKMEERHYVSTTDIIITSYSLLFVCQRLILTHHPRISSFLSHPLPHYNSRSRECLERSLHRQKCSRTRWSH
jgi:hypothetical protein